MPHHEPGTSEVASRPAGSFPARLREETRLQHDRIEANPRFKRLMAPDLSREEYRALVARLYGFHLVAEAAVAGAARMLPPELSLGRRLRRTSLLAADLAALGLSEAAVAVLPLCTMRPCRRAEEAWGVLYLLEGSSLGGQVIARHLAVTLGLTATTGASGMAPYGAETGELWRAFKQALDTAAVDGTLDQDLVISAAQEGFAALDAWVANAW